MQHGHQATLTQPLQCVSPHHVANLHGSTHMATPDDNNHAAIPMRSATTDSRNASTHIDTTTRCRTRRRNPSRPERPQPHPPHTRGTFHRRLQPLYTEKYKVSCSCFLPKTQPRQQSCSHHKVTSSQSHHFPSSPLPLVTPSLSHLFP